MDILKKLKNEIDLLCKDMRNIRPLFMHKGYIDHLKEPIPMIRGTISATLFTSHRKHIYDNDIIAGSICGLYEKDVDEDQLEYAKKLVNSYGYNTFLTNFDHFAPDYESLLKLGIVGILKKIEHSKQIHKNDKKKLDFLESAKISMEGFGKMIEGYADEAKRKSLLVNDVNQKGNLSKIVEVCSKIAINKPETFIEALQLVWLAHISFVCEDRYAMALGRMDQYLYPFYKKDIEQGNLTKEYARELIECTLYKIYEVTHLTDGDDVVNIVIGGITRDGTYAVNELSYIILEAVKNCNIAGPNLSARIGNSTDDVFLDECLKVIGTGIGYPALMNDEINIPALLKYGYSIEDCRDYSMVGCVENFITGKQPPWSDGRYNSPKFLELALNNGKCMQTDLQMGVMTGDVSKFKTMEQFLDAVVVQMEHGADEYMAFFRNENERYNPINYCQPYLSCYCNDCIDRGLDINDGGAYYSSVHGAGCIHKQSGCGIDIYM